MPTKGLRERYLARIADLAGGPGQLYEIAEADEDHVSVVTYKDMPEPGHLTAFSYGLSTANHAEWTFSRPELMISVASKDASWALCMGEIIRNHRTDVLFEYGSVLVFGETIEDGCPMSSFLVFASNLLNAEQQRIALGKTIVNISQLYPIYDSEGDLVLELGAERFFFELGIEFENINRAPARRPTKTRPRKH